MGSFNSDMDSYLSSRRKERPVKVVKMNKPKKSFVEKFFNFFTGDEEEMDEKQEVAQAVSTEASENTKSNEPQPEEKPKKGFFSKFRGIFSSEEEEQERDIPIILVPDDVKELLKIQNKWLMKLPARTIKEFKETDDYKKMRDTLEKYGLLKKN